MRQHFFALRGQLFQLRFDFSFVLFAGIGKFLLQFFLDFVQCRFGIRVNGNRGITQHRLGARRCDLDLVRFTWFGVDDGIVEMPKIAFAFDILDFIIADSRPQMAIPVDQAFTAIDVFLFKEVKESNTDGFGALVVQCEPRSLPIATCSHAFQLAKDTFFVLVFPFPNTCN